MDDLLRAGDCVRIPEKRELLTIDSEERHNGVVFYRVRELPGALFLRRSLTAERRADSLRPASTML